MGWVGLGYPFNQPELLGWVKKKSINPTQPRSCKKKNLTTQPENGGLGWVTNPTNPNFWVGKKKSLNPTQLGPCTSIIFSYASLLSGISVTFFAVNHDYPSNHYLVGEPIDLCQPVLTVATSTSVRKKTSYYFPSFVVICNLTVSFFICSVVMMVYSENFSD